MGLACVVSWVGGAVAPPPQLQRLSLKVYAAVLDSLGKAMAVRILRQIRGDPRLDGDGRAIWPVHFAGLSAAYCQIEKLANLDRLPACVGFTLSCLPVKIARTSARWCRAAAGKTKIKKLTKLKN